MYKINSQLLVGITGVVSDFVVEVQSIKSFVRDCELKNPQEVPITVSYWDAGVVKNPQEVPNAKSKNKTKQHRYNNAQ